MEPAISIDELTTIVSGEMDTFSDSIRRWIDHGLMAQTPGNVFKAQVISRVQSYSAELQFITGEISELFLDLCDLMVSGRLARMPGDTFKIYVVLMAFSGTEDEEMLQDVNTLGERTGINDHSALSQALDQLRKDGYIDSVDDRITRRKRPAEKKNGTMLDRSLSP